MQSATVNVDYPILLIYNRYNTRQIIYWKWFQINGKMK